MQIRNILSVAVVVTTVSAMHANPFVKMHAARAIKVEGGLLPRQASCPTGYNACGTGCSLGPCCDNAAGIACRPNESCTTVDGQTACCATGYTCNAINDCENAFGSSCTPGSVNNGRLCCDATAPLCNTSSGTAYCAGVQPSTTYQYAPPATTGGVEEPSTTSTVTSTSTATQTSTLSASTSSSEAQPSSTSTVSVTATQYSTMTMSSTSNALPTTTETATSGSETSTSSSTTTQTVVVVPTTSGTTSSLYTIQTILPTYNTTITTGTSTFTSVTYLPVPYPTGSGNGSANATATYSPPQQTGAAGKMGMSFGALLGGIVGAVILI